MTNVHYCSDCDNTVEFGHDCPTYVVFVPAKKPDTSTKTMTPEQWKAMFVTSMEAETAAHIRSRMEYWRCKGVTEFGYNG